MECVVDTWFCGMLFWAWGFAFMFGHGSGFIGWGDAKGNTWFFLQNAPDTYESTGIAFLAVWLFQFAFADTRSTITRHDRAHGLDRRPALLGVSGFIYPIIGHCILGAGFPRDYGQQG